MSFTPGQGRVLYEVVAPEFERPRATSRFLRIEHDVEMYLQSENWGRRPLDAPPPAEHTWPAWQREMMAEVRELSPASVVRLRDALWRAFRLVQRGKTVDDALR